MLIPKNIEIFGKSIEVKNVRDLKDDAGAELDGYCILQDQEIHLHSSLKGDFKIVIFLHECIHMILDSSGHEKESKNETFVRTLSEGLYQVIKQTTMKSKKKNAKARKKTVHRSSSKNNQ